MHFQIHVHILKGNSYYSCCFPCFSWRDNPMLPSGVLYEGVSDEPILLSGGSAAQSSTIQCFDALLCIRHEDETGKHAFLSTFDPFRWRSWISHTVCAASWLLWMRIFPRQAIIFILSRSLFCSLHQLTQSRSFPDTHERLHASRPPSADRNSLCLSIAARLHPVLLRLWSLPHLQLLCLRPGGFTKLSPQYRDQVCHCSR